MTGFGASAALAILLAWVILAFAGAALSPPFGAGLAVVAAVGLAFGLKDTLATGGLVALLAPFGVMLPALALRHMAAKLGVPMVPFATWELVLFLVAYTGFLAAAFGVIPVDLYRLGYAPLPVAVMVLVVCAHGALTGNWVVPLVAVLGQLFWVLGWGSSNWFDYVLHVLLWPVALLVLVARAF